MVSSVFNLFYQIFMSTCFSELFQFNNSQHVSTCFMPFLPDSGFDRLQDPHVEVDEADAE